MTQRKKSIPQFKSYEEEAKFWDTHDIADYAGKLKPAKIRFAKNLSQGITVRFDSKTLNELRARARQKGLGPTTYIRMMVLDNLRSFHATL